MNVSLSGRIAVVTGAAQGVGRAIALQLARSGVEGLCLTVRDPGEGEAVAAEARALGTRVCCVEGDLTQDDAPQAVVQRCVTEFGRVDLLVNAAGRTDRASLVTATPALWDTLFAINCRVPTFLMQAAVADMRRRGAGGAIVNILTMNVHCGIEELALYASAKAALALLTKNAAQAHRFDRIRINGINMGWAATPAERQMQAVTLGKGEGWLREAEAAQPYGRLLEAEDVARLACFLLSDAALPMTGALIDQEQWVNGRME